MRSDFSLNTKQNKNRGHDEPGYSSIFYIGILGSTRIGGWVSALLLILILLLYCITPYGVLLLAIKQVV